MLSSFYTKTQIDSLLKGYPSSTAALGYSSGSGLGIKVTQLYSKSTAISGNGLCGFIITSNSTLSPDAHADFILTNELVLNTDVVVCAVSSVSVNPLNYSVVGFCFPKSILFRITKIS